MEEVILVNKTDEPIGKMEKIEAHQKGLLHRAFSVFIFNHEGEILLQKRAKSKYHSGGLWTNACCGHPRPGEETLTAAKRRLMEEMKIDCSLYEVFSFQYKAALDDITENEIDHVVVGTYTGPIDADPDEAETWKFVSSRELINDININPDNYSVWFKMCFEKALLEYKNKTHFEEKN